MPLHATTTGRSARTTHLDNEPIAGDCRVGGIDGGTEKHATQRGAEFGGGYFPSQGLAQRAAVIAVNADPNLQRLIAISIGLQPLEAELDGVADIEHRAGGERIRNKLDVVSIARHSVIRGVWRVRLSGERRGVRRRQWAPRTLRMRVR